MSADILPPTAVESQVTALDNSTASTSSAPATSPKSTTSPRAPSAASPLLTKLRQQPSRHARHDQLTTGSSPATINASSPSHHNSESSRHSTPATSTGGDSIEQPHTQQTDAQSAPSSERPTQDNESAAHVSQAPPLPESTPSQALPNANAEHPLASIKPAYFYPLDANSSGQDGVPVFEPTMEQFRDFYAFCQAIDSWGMQSGIVKVIPPKEWRDALPDLRPAMPDSRTDTQPPATPEQDEPADISKVRIRNAIAQHFTLAGSGVWRQTNITRTVKIWNAKQWAETCVSEGQKGPEMDRMKWKVEVDGVSNNGWGPKSIGGKDEPHSAILEEDGVRTRSGKARPLLAPNDVRAGTKRKRGAAEHQDKRQSAEPSSARPSTPQPQTGTQTRSQSQPRSPPSQTQQRSPMTRSREAKEAATAAAAAGTVSTPEGSPAKAKKNWAAEATTFEEWRNFDYRNTWLREGLSHEQIAKFDQESGDAQTVDGAADPNAASSSSDAHGDGEKNTNQQQAVQLPSPTDWNEETCREIESEYWRSLNFGKPPMYGADLKGTLFDHRTKDWNVGHLDNLLTRLRLKRKLPGVNTPYLYWGMWKATFAWHVEDMDLYSINYIHFGAPKQWYSIRQADRQRFESAMAGAFPSDSRRCPHFMRHKSYLASPSFLASHGIRPLKLVHHAGEFVITYPYGYHSGFNLGFNCAESVNFALDSWLDIGRKANYCHCDQSQNSVHIDVDAMLEESKEMEELERKREVRRAKDESVKAIEEEELERRRIRNEKARERRKLKREQEATGTMTGGGGMAAGGAVSLLFQGGDDFYIDPKSASTSPCVFCPANVAADLVATPATIPTANPKLKAMAGRHAHRLCASFVPETWVGKQGKTEVVSGIEGIDKARFSLKCQICPDANLQKLYPKIQCTRGKCARSAHVSCALVETHGWFIDVCPIDVADRLEAKKGPATSMAAPDGAEPDVPADDGEDEGGERLVVLCRTHNPLFREAEEARRAEELRDRISSLPLPSTIRIKTSGGMFEALMVDVHEDEDEVVIEDQGRPSTVKFHQIILAEAKVESPPPSIDAGPVKLESQPDEEDTAEGQPAPKRKRRASRKAADEVGQVQTAPPVTEERLTAAVVPAAPRPASKKKAVRISAPQDDAAAVEELTATTDSKPKRKRAPAKNKKAESAGGEAPAKAEIVVDAAPVKVAKNAKASAAKEVKPKAVRPAKKKKGKDAASSDSAAEDASAAAEVNPDASSALAASGLVEIQHSGGPRGPYPSQPGPYSGQYEAYPPASYPQSHYGQHPQYAHHSSAYPQQPYGHYPHYPSHQYAQGHGEPPLQHGSSGRLPYPPQYGPSTHSGHAAYEEGPRYPHAMHEQHVTSAPHPSYSVAAPSSRMSHYSHPAAPPQDYAARSAPPLPTYARPSPKEHTQELASDGGRVTPSGSDKRSQPSPRYDQHHPQQHLPPQPQPHPQHYNHPPPQPQHQHPSYAYAPAHNGGGQPHNYPHHAAPYHYRPQYPPSQPQSQSHLQQHPHQQQPYPDQERYATHRYSYDHPQSQGLSRHQIPASHPSQSSYYPREA